MEACIVIKSLRQLVRHPTSLCSLIFRSLAELMGLFPSVLGKFRGDPPPMENMVGKSPEPEPELPPDMLSSIFALLEVPDLVRAGSVCSSWRSVYTGLRRQLRQHKQRQTPCLLYHTSESTGENAACLYSLAEKRAYKLTLPDPPIRSRYLIGSSHGWLITSDERSELHLVNPITGEQIVLPSVITLEQVKPIFDDEGAIHKYELWEPRYTALAELLGHEPSIYALDELRDRLYFKAYLFPDPQTGSYIVVLIHNPEYQISFARAGGCGWTFLPPGWNYQECIYKDGLLYAVTGTGAVDAFDLSGSTVTRTTVLGDMKNSISEHIYIVQAPWGDMLQVWRQQPIVAGDADSENIMETSKIFVYKIDMAAKKLVEINGLHGHVLFLGHSQTQCLSVEEYPQLKANCVYFTDDDRFISLYQNSKRDIGVLNLESGCREEIVPQIYCTWPNPIWITPSLRMMHSGLM
ncbi:putative F-box protein At2g33190 isoform X1 [Aegilops tauschii subsp. strangulata]|uniref:F-box domain-containing protein n=2 Tax=Aegilops tauschii subsp. strangulata TaxID=200361 RepID=A0A453PJN2_AEGTS|nr:putative F-box protein At2g33190 isoform X1 [Aegilops tauschii subsp. strangulata]